MKKIDRIIAALPSNRDHRFNALTVIIKLARGENVHLYWGWTNRFRRLSKETGVSAAMAALDRAGVSYEQGNDAPRGGSLGDFIKLTRRIPSAIPALEALQAQIRAERGY